MCSFLSLISRDSYVSRVLPVRPCSVCPKSSRRLWRHDPTRTPWEKKIQYCTVIYCCRKGEHEMRMTGDPIPSCRLPIADFPVGMTLIHSNTPIWLPIPNASNACVKRRPSVWRNRNRMTVCEKLQAKRIQERSQDKCHNIRIQWTCLEGKRRHRSFKCTGYYPRALGTQSILVHGMTILLNSECQTPLQWQTNPIMILLLLLSASMYRSVLYKWIRHVGRCLFDSTIGCRSMNSHDHRYDQKEPWVIPEQTLESWTHVSGKG